MIRVILIICLVFSSLNQNAQTNLDSLWQIWSNDSLIDTIRLEAIYEYVRSDEMIHYPDSAKKVMQEMLDFAVDIDNRYYQGLAYRQFGDLFQNESNYNKAQKNFFEALRIFEESGKTEHKNYLQSTHYYLGHCFFELGQYPKAIKHYSTSAQLSEELGRNKGYELNSLGLIYKLQGEYNRAIDYFEKSAELSAKDNFPYGEAVPLGNIGRVHSELGNYSEALLFLNKKMQIIMLAEKNQFYNCGMMSTLAALGETYMKMKDYSMALDQLMQSLEYHEKASFECTGEYDLERRIGTVYENMGQWDQAIEWCTKGYKIAVKKSLLPAQPSACDCLYKAYENKGDYRIALEYLKLRNLLLDSLDREESIKSLQQMEFDKQMLVDSIATAEEARLVEEAHKEEVRKKNKTQNVLIGAGLFLFMIVGGISSRLRYVRRSKATLQVEKDRSENLLLNILPADIAEELKEKGRAEAREFKLASILFTDFKQFTEKSENLSAQELVAEINICFEVFDKICEKYKIEKIKTIGDAYMAAGGLPVPSNDSVKNTVLTAIEMQEFMTEETRHKTQEPEGQQPTAGSRLFEMRVGVHTGPVVAGIVGVKKFQYDIWGDTVNTASRMESYGEVSKVNISQATYKLLKDDPDFTFESRGKIEAKGKGEIEMYFVSKT